MRSGRLDPQAWPSGERGRVHALSPQRSVPCSSSGCPPSEVGRFFLAGAGSCQSRPTPHLVAAPELAVQFEHPVALEGGIFRRAIARGELGVNACTGLELPAVRGGRDRIALPDEAAIMLAALPDDDRAILGDGDLRRSVRRRTASASARRGRPRARRHSRPPQLGPDGGGDLAEEPRRDANRPDRRGAPDAPSDPPAPGNGADGG